MSDPRRKYEAYLLRLWQAQEGGSAVWRASLESPRTGERRGFTSLVELFTFLESEVCQVIQDQTAPTAGEKGGGIETRDPYRMGKNRGHGE
jgi:hypothetical protein